MGDVELALVSEENYEERLNHQIEIYHKLKEQSIQIIRLIVATATVAIALISAVLSGIFEIGFELRGVMYYLNQTAQNSGANPAETGIIAIILMNIGMIGISTSILASTFGFTNIINVITHSGIYPYMPYEDGRRVEFVQLESESKAARRATLKINNRILSEMDNNMAKSYQYLGSSVTLLVFGIMMFGIAYFSELRLTRYIAIAIVGSAVAAVASKVLFRIIDYRPHNARKRFDWIDEQKERFRIPIFSLLLFLFLVVPMAGILYILEGYLAITAVVGTSIVLAAVSHGIFIYAEVDD